MNKENVSVLIVNKAQDHTGILVNVGFVLGLTAGRELPNETFGREVVDGDGSQHPYLTNIGHIVRKAGQSKLRTLRNEFAQHPDVLVVDYTEDAAPVDYETYANGLESKKGEEIEYRAVYVYGPADIIIPKTKSLSAL